MIDRFHKLIAYRQEYEKSKSPITLFKMYHRKYEIMREFKNKKVFSPEDLCNYGWIINWAKEKWSDDEYLFPQFFNARGIDGYYYFDFDREYYGDHFTITARNLKLISNLEVNVYNSNRSVVRYECSKLELHSESTKENKIFFTCLEYVLDHILTRLIRGDKDS